MDEQEQIQTEFEQSWDDVQAFFHDLATYPKWVEYAHHMLTLIGLLRARGMHKQFRAGQSIFYLMLSRARQHGLRPGQPFLRMRAMPDDSIVCEYVVGSMIEKFSIQPVAISFELEVVLNALLSHDVD